MATGNNPTFRTDRQASPLPVNLRRNAPLVPSDSSGGRALSAVIAILTFLAALCAGAAELVATSSADWRSSVSREVTIQIRPNTQRNIEADVVQATELARTTPGVKEARAFSAEEAAKLLEPWLGTGLDLKELPVPRLIVLTLADGPRPDFSTLRTQLTAQIPGATLDDHSLWVARLAAMANTVVVIGIVLVILVLSAAGLAVAFATRGAMAGNREAVEVLHFVGADDDFIAREFQRRFFQIGLRGAVFGSFSALALILVLGMLSRLWRTSAAGDQIEALFGSFSIGWRGFAVVIAISLVVAGIAAIVSRRTVRRFLIEASE